MMWILALLFAGLTQGEATSSDVAKVVACTEIAFSDAAESRDRGAFAAFLHPDVRFISGSVDHGPLEVLEAWSVFFDPNGPMMRWRPETVEVNAEGNLALTRGPYRMTRIDADGKSSESWGSFISVWRKGDDGRWRIQFDTGADPGMEPSDEQRQLMDQESSCGGGVSG